MIILIPVPIRCHILFIVCELTFYQLPHYNRFSSQYQSSRSTTQLFILNYSEDKC